MANTDATLLIVTMVVSFLHMIFEYLAFKADVSFWQQTDGEVIHKFISIKSLVAGIFCQLVLTMYLYDEQSNMLLLGFSCVSILVDVWKVKRVMRISYIFALGFLPVPILLQKHSPKQGVAKGKQQAPDFDGQACKWLSLGLCPVVMVYAAYSLTYDCHR